MNELKAQLLGLFIILFPILKIAGVAIAVSILIRLLTPKKDKAKRNNL